jgi:pimeloyl-ACP methyl ester carboxylesterase
MRYGPPFTYTHRQDGRRIAYQVVGQGDLDLVFLFGWPTHLGLMWEVRHWFRVFMISAATLAEQYEGIRSLGPVDIRGLLGTVQAPVLVLHQTGDRAADVRASRYMAERIPDAWQLYAVELAAA